MPITATRPQKPAVQAVDSRPTPDQDELVLSGGLAEVATPAPEVVTQTPKLTPELQALSQNLSSDLISGRGQAVFSEMVGVAQQDAGLLELFKGLGKASETLGDSSKPDMFYHLAQNLHHLSLASDAVMERQQAGSTETFGTLLSEEMKVQAEGLALHRFASPSLVQELVNNQEVSEARLSADAKNLAKLKAALPSEVVQQAPTQPLEFAAPLAQGIEAEAVAGITLWADSARNFLPLALGARGVFFQSVHGEGQHPALELSRVGQALGQDLLLGDHGLKRISPEFAGFATKFVGPDSDISQGFEQATNLQLLVLAMQSGDQHSRMMETPREENLQSSVKTLVRQQTLQRHTSPVLHQAAFETAGQSAVGQIPEQVYNQTLSQMMSVDQLAAAEGDIARHPLTQLAEQENLSQLYDSFAFPPSGQARVRSALKHYTDDLISVQQAVGFALQSAPL